MVDTSYFGCLLNMLLMKKITKDVKKIMAQMQYHFS